MSTLKITRKDFKKSDSYYLEYVGKTDLNDFQGSVEIEAGLGWVRFPKIKVSGSIVSLDGSSIEAGESIEAGLGIETGEGIRAGEDIRAGSGIEAGLGIKAGLDIEAGESIEAGWDIKAGESIKADLDIKAGWSIKAGKDIVAGADIEADLSIKAGESIRAGWGIKAGLDIEAGEGIVAGEGIRAALKITCKGVLSFCYAIYAGVCTWRDASEEDQTITCGRLEKKRPQDKVVGILKETGVDDIKKSDLLAKADKLIAKANELK